MIWRAINLRYFENCYEVSDTGAVKRTLVKSGTYKGRILKPQISINGYYRVRLVNFNSEKQWVAVHRLVASAFLNYDLEVDYRTLQINHKDGNKLNNNSSNLEIVTHSQNKLHGYAIGLISAKGEKNSQAVLTNEKIKDIRFKSLFGFSGKDLAKMYNVSPGTISMILSGQRWSHC